MKKNFLLTVFTLCFSLFFFSMSIVRADAVNNQFEPPKVTTEMIPEFSTKAKVVHTVQPMQLHTAEIVNKLYPTNPQKNNLDVMKFLYPKATTAELGGMSATFDQCLSYLANQKINYTKKSGFLDETTILNEIKQKRPVLVHLKAKSSYWLEPESAVIIYGVQIFEFPGMPKNTLYYTRSLNHTDSPILSGLENEFDLLIGEKGKDPSLNGIFYKWENTAYGIRK